jgi:hypothetical protein
MHTTRWLASRALSLLLMQDVGMRGGCGCT